MTSAIPSFAVEWEDRNRGSLATKSQMLPDQVKKDATSVLEASMLGLSNWRQHTLFTYMIHHDSWLDKFYSTPSSFKSHEPFVLNWVGRGAKNHAHWIDRKRGSRFSAAWRFRTPTNSEKIKHCNAKTRVQRYLRGKMFAGSFPKYDWRWWLCVVNWIFQLRCGQKIPLPCRFGIGSEWSDIGRLANGRFPPRIGRRVIRARSAKARECTFAYTMCIHYDYIIYIYE